MDRARADRDASAQVLPGVRCSVLSGHSAACGDVLGSVQSGAVTTAETCLGDDQALGRDLAPAAELDGRPGTVGAPRGSGAGEQGVQGA